jgi:hypothetical protein
VFFDVGDWTAGAGAEVDDFPAVVVVVVVVIGAAFGALDYAEDFEDYSGG